MPKREVNKEEYESHASVIRLIYELRDAYENKVWDSHACKQIWELTYTYERLKNNVELIIKHILSFNSSYGSPFERDHRVMRFEENFRKSDKETIRQVGSEFSKGKNEVINKLNEVVIKRVTGKVSDFKFMETIQAIIINSDRITKNLRAYLDSWESSIQSSLTDFQLAGISDSLKQGTSRFQETRVDTSPALEHLDKIISEMKDLLSHEPIVGVLDDKSMARTLILKDTASAEADKFMVAQALLIALCKRHPSFAELILEKEKGSENVPGISVFNVSPLARDSMDRIKFPGNIKEESKRVGKVVIESSEGDFCSTHSPIAPISINDEGTQSHTGVPQDARHYCFVYPILKEKQRMAKTTPIDLLMLFGGFVYWDNDWNKIAVNALWEGSENSQHDKKLYFNRPVRFLNKRVVDAERLRWVTFPAFTDAGFDRFAWYTKGEIGLGGHGRFLFERDGDFFACSLLKNFVGERLLELDRAENDYERESVVSKMLRKKKEPLG